MNLEDSIFLVEPKDVLTSLGEWIRLERQRLCLTQGDLAKKSNVPATTISRLERTGLSSTDSLMRILFVLDRLVPLKDFLNEHLRIASFSKRFSEDLPERKIQRIRRKK